MCGNCHCWVLAGLDAESTRGLPVTTLRARIGGQVETATDRCHAHVTEALDGAFDLAQKGDRIIAFGSFLVAATAIEVARIRAINAA